MRSARNPCTRKIFFFAPPVEINLQYQLSDCIFGKNSLNLEVLTLSTFKSGLVLSLYAHPAFLLLSSLVLCLCRRRLHHLPDLPPAVVVEAGRVMGAFPLLNGEEKMMPLHTLVKMNEVYVP